MHGGHHKHDAGDKRLAAAIAVNLALTVAQVAGGLLSGSLGLIADALHNLSDAVGLIIAAAARRIARRPADNRMTYGYARAEVVAALVNYTAVITIALALAVEGVGRLFDPQEVDGWLVVIVAGLALAVDLVTAAVTYQMAKTSMNIRAAFVHNLADAAGSLGVIVAGALIIWYDWRLADPLITLAISGYILWLALSEIGGSIRVLMQGAPAGLDVERLTDALEATPGVEALHHVRVWAIDERQNALEAHVVVPDRALADAEAVKRSLRDTAAEHGIHHTTFELEVPLTCH